MWLDSPQPIEGERETDVLNLVVSPISDDGQIHFNLVVIRLIPTIHDSFLLRLTYLLSSSTCFFHVLFELFLQNLMPFSRNDHLLSTCNPTNEHRHSQLIYGFIQTKLQHKFLSSFLSLSCTPHIALTKDLSIIKFISLSGTMFHFHA